MFEDMVMQLDEMGVQYTEDYEMESLTIDVGSLDKINLINVIQMANDSGMEFTVDEASLVIQAGTPPVKAPMEEEVPGDDIGALRDDALGQMF